MAIPQAFLDVLNTLQILPLPRAQPGDLLKPQINKDLAIAFGPLRLGEVLGQLDLNVLFNDVSLDLITGQDTSEIVLKQVEFTPTTTPLQAAQLDTSETAAGKLPYIAPIAGVSSNAPPVPKLGALVEGLIGKITTEASQAGSITGSLVGTIKGDLKKAAALASFTPPTLSWRIDDERGNPLVSGTHFVVDTANPLTAATPVLALLPVFVPLSNPTTVTTAKRSLFCDLTFNDINGVLTPPFKFSIGPATFEV